MRDPRTGRSGRCGGGGGGAAREAEPADGPAGAARPLVLLVEDEALLAMDLEEALAAAGYDVAWAPDGPAALAGASGAAAGHLAAAVVDLGLPNGTRGQEVVRALRAAAPGRRPPLPVVVVTGHAPETPQADLRGLGGPTERLTKPFRRAELLGRLAEVLARGPGHPGPDRRRRPRSGGGGPTPRGA